jgi:hypothetical protein
MILYILVSLVVILFLHYYYQLPVHSETIVRSGGKFYVVQDLPDKQIAGDILFTINENLKKIILHLKQKLPDDPNVNLMYTRFIKRDTVLKEGHLRSAYTTYTINKGHKMVFCLRTRDSQQQLYDTNTLMYVALHELAHIGSVSYHHTEEFKKVFEMILQTAVDLGYYTYIDYSKRPKEYCGLVITDNLLNK